MLNTTEVVVLAIVGVACLFYIQRWYFEVSYVKSSVDGNKYICQNREDKQTAADMLARLNRKIKTLLAHLKENHGEKEGLVQLLENYDENNISEGTGDSNFTSYSVNKGEKIVLCLRQREEGEEKYDGSGFVDENVLMYVATHELGHLMTKEIGHTQSFWENFKFLIQEAEKAGLYERVNYAKDSVRYCGLNIKHSII